MTDRDLIALEPAQQRSFIRTAAVRQAAVMTGYPIGKELADFFAIKFNSLFSATCGVIDATCVLGDTSLKSIRVFADIVQEAARPCRYAGIEAASESTGKSTRAPEVPFQALPRIKWLAWTTVCIEDAMYQGQKAGQRPIDGGAMRGRVITALVWVRQIESE